MNLYNKDIRHRVVGAKNVNMLLDAIPISEKEPLVLQCNKQANKV